MLRRALIIGPIVGAVLTLIGGRQVPLGVTLEIFTMWTMIGAMTGALWGLTSVARRRGYLEQDPEERLARARNTLIWSMVAMAFILLLAFVKGDFSHPTTDGRRHLLSGVTLFGVMGLYGGGKLLLESRRQRRALRPDANGPTEIVASPTSSTGEQAKS